jgi:putative hemolysin
LGRCGSFERSAESPEADTIEGKETSVWGIELVVMALMVLINALFAAYEIALASVPIARLQLLFRENRHGAAAALAMKQSMEGSLAVIQLGVALVGAIAAATAGAGAEEQIAPALRRAGLSSGLAEFISLIFVVIPLTAFIIVVGELAPKLFALRHREWVCLKLSPGLRWLSIGLRPAVWVLETSATALADWGERLWKPGLHPHATNESAELQELRAIASLARTARLIGAREENIILGAARLSSRNVKEIVLPAEHIGMLNVTDSIAECLVAAHLDMHTRFPVTERPGDPQAIIGYVNFKDIVASMRLSPHEHSLRGIVRAIPGLSEDVPIASALESLMRGRVHIALVRDRAGKIVGMITLEDILEELIGDIQDEYDLLPMHVVPSGVGWVAGGGISLSHLRELTGIDLSQDLPPQGAVNLNSWIAGHLGKPARGGEILERNGLRIVVRKVRRKQVLEAQVSRRVTVPPPASPSAASTS